MYIYGLAHDWDTCFWKPTDSHNGPHKGSWQEIGTKSLTMLSTWYRLLSVLIIDMVWAIDTDFLYVYVYVYFFIYDMQLNFEEYLQVLKKSACKITWNKSHEWIKNFYSGEIFMIY